MSEISVVIPVHNEEAVLAHCLDGILADARPGEFEIIVACNDCSDHSAEVAKSYGAPVHVVETAARGKVIALNLGDAAATCFPRFYIDADVQISTAALRAVAERLRRGEALAAAPAIEVEVEGRSWPIRAYYAIWIRLPWVRESMIGSGVVGVSEAGRRRFDRFPPVPADDYWLSAQFAPAERVAVAEFTFAIEGSRSLWGLVRRKARILAWNRLTRDAVRGAPGLEPRRGAAALLSVLRREPRLWPQVIMYAAIAPLAHLYGRWLVLRNSTTWLRDR